MIRGLAALVAVTIAACEPPPVSSVGAPLTDAEAVGTCGFANVGWTGSCSASLIHPRVLITAAHCGSPRAIRLGERSPWQLEIATTSCTPHPRFTGSWEWDYLVCVLAEDAPVPVIPPAMGCEVTDMERGRPVVPVGFGRDDRGLYGVKRMGRMQFDRFLPGSETAAAMVAMAPSEGTLQPGDSGGPTFVALSDGTFRQLGVHSSASVDGGIDSVLARAVPWIEETTGIDVTPCHDADGTFSPGPSCRDLPTDPATSDGAWPTCTTPLATPAGSTCGGDEPDAGDAPSAPDSGVVAHDRDAAAPDGGGTSRAPDSGAATDAGDVDEPDAERHGGDVSGGCSAWSKTTTFVSPTLLVVALVLARRRRRR